MRGYHHSIRRLLALVLAGSMVLSGCAQRQQAAADIMLDVTQPTVGTTPVSVTLHDAQGRPLSGADVQLRGDMTHAGMQPVITTMNDVGGGQYRADDFEFTMAGDWVLTVEAELPDGGRVERMFDVRGVTN